MSIIRTKHIGATNTTGARVQAKLANKTISLSYDYALSGADNHERVANALATKLNLKGKWARIWDQSQREGNTYICLTDAHSEFTVA